MDEDFNLMVDKDFNDLMDEDFNLMLEDDAASQPLPNMSPLDNLNTKAILPVNKILFQPNTVLDKHLVSDLSCV